MALKIRLRRMGRKKAPTYRIVVAESTMPRDGRFVESIGHYNPRTEPLTLVVDRDRALFWLDQGAMATDTAKSLLKRAGVFGPAPTVTEEVAEGVREVAKKTSTRARNAAASAAAKVAEVAEDVREVVEDAAEDVREAVGEAAEDVRDAVEDAVEEVRERLGGEDADEPAATPEATAEEPAATPEATTEEQAADEAKPAKSE